MISYSEQYNIGGTGSINIKSTLCHSTSNVAVAIFSTPSWASSSSVMPYSVIVLPTVETQVPSSQDHKRQREIEDFLERGSLGNGICSCV